MGVVCPVYAGEMPMMVREFLSKAKIRTDYVQKIDMGIALCHFMSVTGGNLAISDPGIAIDENMEYIATVLI